VLETAPGTYPESYEQWFSVVVLLFLQLETASLVHSNTEQEGWPFMGHQLFTFYVSEIIRSLLESKLDQKIREVDI
jgi:hypothetical protein